VKASYYHVTDDELACVLVLKLELIKISFFKENKNY